MGSENDYSIKTKPVIPKYKFSKLYQQTGGQDRTITTSATESIFEIPARCVNFSNSSLNYTITLAALATRTHWLYADVIAPIRQIQLYTRGGVYLCNLDNVDRFSSVVLKTEISKSEADIADKEIDAEISTTVESFGEIYGNLVNSNFRYDGEDRYVVGEPVYLREDYGVELDTVLNYEIPLNLFKNTILELNKDLFFNEVLLLKITWNDYLSWGFTAGLGTPAANVLPLAADIVMSNLSLYLALESNPFICAGLISQVQSSGLNTIIPYTYCFRNTQPASISQNVSIRMNRAYGRYLKRIYHVVYKDPQTGASRYDHSNSYRAGALTGGIASYYTTIDNDRRQEFDIQTIQNEDWLLIKNDLEYAVIQRLDTYRKNWFVLDKFDDDVVGEKFDIIESGIPLDFERKWDYISTTGSTAAATHMYTYAVVTRELRVASDGIFVM